jgi:molecular chaperone HscB
VVTEPLVSDVNNCWNCKEEVKSLTKCPNCYKMLPIPESENYFQFFGLKNQLNIDLEELERKFFEFCKECHPDFFTNCQDAEKDVCISRMSFINNAYKVLKDPISRAKYLLRLERGETTEDKKKVPRELLFEVMELQEKIELVKSEKDTENIRILNEEINQMKTEFENKINNLNIELSNLFTKWDTLVDDKKNNLRQTVLEDINNNLLVRTYLLNLISTLNR